MSDIAWFKEISNKDVELVGGKGASLGALYNAKFPIPPGFCVTAEAYKKFITKTKINEKIYEILKDLDIQNNDILQSSAKKVQKTILDTPMPEDLKESILESYDALNINLEKTQNQDALDIAKSNGELPLVAVRSSATAEDLPTASFAGQQASFLNIKGQENLIQAVKDCWASLFTARAIYYRIKNKFEHEKVFISVVIQKMINAKKSGVMFSVNPMNNNSEEILIEAGWGLGEAVVSGAITPDQYIVNLKEKKIKNIQVNKQTWEFILDKEKAKTIKKDIEEERQTKQILTNEEIIHLAEYANKSEEFYKSPQDLEFAIENNQIFIVQSRPITTLKKDEEKNETKEINEETTKDLNVIVKGISASPGVGQGKVKIVKDSSELSKVEKGDVLVAIMTNPDYVVAMEKSSAIVTDEGGSTSHAAIVGREMGIPVIVGTSDATKILKENDEVTVDASSGKVYQGIINISNSEENETSENEDKNISTVTEIKVIMDLPKYAEKAAKSGADGVGLLRGEFINLGNKVHPSHMIKTGKKEEFVKNLTESLATIASAFKDKPVWYRTLDAPTDEFRKLEGGEDEPKENNPMMGWRSIRRSLDDPELFKAELEAVKKAHDNGHTNIGIMIPLVTHVEQVSKAKEYLKEVGLEPRENIDFGIMVETPAAVQIIEELCNEGIDFVSFGTNDLTQFTLAVDRNSAKVQKWYNEMHPSILKQIKHVVQICRKYGVETSICGQAGSKPEMAEFLVKIGIDSISTNPDAVQKIKQSVARAEKKLLLNVARKDFNNTL